MGLIFQVLPRSVLGVKPPSTEVVTSRDGVEHAEHPLYIHAKLVLIPTADVDKYLKVGRWGDKDYGADGEVDPYDVKGDLPAKLRGLYYEKWETEKSGDVMALDKSSVWDASKRRLTIKWHQGRNSTYFREFAGEATAWFFALARVEYVLDFNEDITFATIRLLLYGTIDVTFLLGKFTMKELPESVNGSHWDRESVGSIQPVSIHYTLTRIVEDNGTRVKAEYDEMVARYPPHTLVIEGSLLSAKPKTQPPPPQTSDTPSTSHPIPAPEAGQTVNPTPPLASVTTIATATTVPKDVTTQSGVPTPSVIGGGPP